MELINTVNIQFIKIYYLIPKALVLSNPLIFFKQNIQAIKTDLNTESVLMHMLLVHMQTCVHTRI